MFTKAIKITQKTIRVASSQIYYASPIIAIRRSFSTATGAPTKVGNTS